MEQIKFPRKKEYNKRARIPYLNFFTVLGCVLILIGFLMIREKRVNYKYVPVAYKGGVHQKEFVVRMTGKHYIIIGGILLYAGIFFERKIMRD